MFFRKFLATIIILVAVCSCSCSKTENQKSNQPDVIDEDGKIKIVTTILPVYDLAVNVGGDRVEVVNLLPPGASPHTYEPTPEDARSVEEADLILKIGLQLDDWVEKTVAGSNSKGKIHEVSRDVALLSSEAACSGHHHNQNHDNEDKENKKTIDMRDKAHREGSRGQISNPDPHVWMDPVRMKVMAATVKDILSEKMPSQSEYFEMNNAKYAFQLENLDKGLKSALSLPGRKDYVTVHNFMNYLGNRYNLHCVAVISDFPGKEPDPKHIAEVVDKLKEMKVRVIFVEPQFSPKASEAIAREVNGTVAVIDPIGSLNDPQRDTYVKNMFRNMETLFETFKNEIESQ